MSLLNYLMDELVNQPIRRQYGNIYDQNFGLGLLENSMAEPSRLVLAPLRCGYVRPWRNVSASESGVSRFTVGKEGFKVSLDVQQFKPEELIVKVVDGFVVVEGKHEERMDEHGFISRQFARRYKVPERVNVDALTSKLSNDGVLFLEAPPIQPASESNEKIIPITQVTSQVGADGKGDHKAE